MFCQIVAGRSPVEMVREGERVIAFKPLDPVTEGHTLVIPRSHSAYVWGMSDKDLTHTIRMVAELAAEYHPANIIQSNGHEATQSVFHVHFHVVPRRKGDRLRLPWG